jgi:uncharacterized protein YbaR (Trm112 family)
MRLDPALLEILACPNCHSPLRVDEEASELVCTDTAAAQGARDHDDREQGAREHCGLIYPVREDIPVLLVDEARKPA